MVSLRFKDKSGMSAGPSEGSEWACDRRRSMAFFNVWFGPHYLGELNQNEAVEKWQVVRRPRGGSEDVNGGGTESRVTGVREHG